ncbi:MAG: thioredoxin [Bacteroidia bacterium]|nr:thioredoxin [Bacteroidia bacterium]
MKNTIRFAFLISIFALGCSGSQAQKIENTDATGFQDKLKTELQKTILDVRTPEEYNNGHIPNAININVNGSDFETAVQKLDTQKTIFVYCLAGSRSARAADILAQMGFKNIVNLEGGYSQWSAAGFPTEKGATSKTNAPGISDQEFQKMVSGDSLVLIDFNAKWCTPCKKITAILEELKPEYAGKLTIIALDYDQNTAIIQSAKVETVPTLRLYKSGKIVWDHKGACDKATLAAAIKAQL